MGQPDPEDQTDPRRKIEKGWFLSVSEVAGAITEAANCCASEGGTILVTILPKTNKSCR